MSTPMLLERASIRWNDDALDMSGSWFAELDEILKNVDPDSLVAVRRDADTWYVINDADLVVGKDETFGTGLDTWDF